MGEAGILAGFTMAPLSPEQQARERIDQMLLASGWALQSKKTVNPTAAWSLVDREYDTDPADHIPVMDNVMANPVLE